MNCISHLEVWRAQKERGCFSLGNLLSAQFITQTEARPLLLCPSYLKKAYYVWLLWEGLLFKGALDKNGISSFCVLIADAGMLLIQNATNDWTKSWLFLPSLCRKSVKLFVRNFPWNFPCCANRIALSFVGVLHDRVFFFFFFLNNVADFSDVVRVKRRRKKSRFRPAVGGV